MRKCLCHSLIVIAVWGVCWRQSADTNDNSPLLHTGVTGQITASGLNDPQYVLSFVQVQRLMLTAVQHPLSQSEVAAGLKGTPVSIDDLVRLNLIRRDGATLRLNYLLLTVQDQKLIYAASQTFGESLGKAFAAHHVDFERIVRAYPDSDLRSRLLFDLVAGAALNWGGLDLTTQLGYRIKPPRHSNGDVYFVHSEERGANLDLIGLYLDSETAPGSVMSFSTFGDGSSRLLGLPDIFDGIETASNEWHSLPEVYGALRSEYITYLLLALDDAGQVMNAVACGMDTESSIAKAVSIPADRRGSALRLLIAIGYLKLLGRRYSVGVPIITEKNRRMVNETLQLSRQIMTDWLQENYPAMQKRLANLSPMRNGVPFSLAFSEVWHYTFGFATKWLAENRFHANPHSQGNRYDGYVPLVWQNSVLKGPK